MDISVYIPHGRENAISRKALQDLTGFPDRNNRKRIERARLNGVPILSSAARGGGYWRSSDTKEMRKFCKELRDRATTLWKEAEAIERSIAKDEGYKVVPVKAHFRRVGRTDENQLTLWG